MSSDTGTDWCHCLYIYINIYLYFCLGIFPSGTMVKNLPANAGDARDVGLIPGSRRSPGEGNGNPLQYSCLGNCMDRGAWWATVHRVAHSWTRLNNWAHTCIDIYMTLMLSAFLSQFWCTLYFSSLQSKKHTAWLFHEGLWWVSVREGRGLSPRIPHTKHCSPGRCPENLPCALQGGNLIHQRICDLDFSFD